MKNKRISLITALTGVVLTLILAFGSGAINLNMLSDLLPPSHRVEVNGNDFIIMSSDLESDKLLVRYVYIDGSESSLRNITSKERYNNKKGEFTTYLISSNKKVDHVEVYNWLKSKNKIFSRNLEQIVSPNDVRKENVMGATNDSSYQVKILTNNGFNVISKEVWSGELAIDHKDLGIEAYSGLEVDLIDTIDQASDIDRVKRIDSFDKNTCRSVEGFAPEDCGVDDTIGDISFNYIVTEDGTIFEGRNRLKKSLSNESDPKNNLSVLFLTKGDAPLSKVQQDTGSKLLTLLLELNQLEKEDLLIKNGDRADLINIKESIRTNTEKGKGSVIAEYSESVEKIVENEKIVVRDNKAQLIIPEAISSVEEKIIEAYSGEDITIGDDRSIYIDLSLLEIALIDLHASNGGSLVQPNKIYTISSWNNSNANRSIPSDYSPTTHWYLEKIRMPEAWSDMGGCSSDNSCGGSQSVKVAVLDTGVAYEDYDYDAGDNYNATRFDPFWVEVPGIDSPDGGYNEGYDRRYRKHPELSNITFINPYDSWQDYSCNVLRLTGSNPDPCNATELSKISHANDDHGHGTFVTGIIAANTSDSAPNLVTGIAHNVQIMPVKVFTPNDRSMCLDSNGNIDLTCSNANGDYRSVAFTTTLVYGINHAVNNGAKVINMSLGGPGNDPLVENAISNAVNNDVLVVVASGNDNDDANYYFPANSPRAFTVGASTPTNSRASYSNYGSVIDIVAPVGDSSTSKTTSIRYTCSTTGSCWDETNPNIFQSFTSTTTPNTGIGTSYAAPQVTAAAALIKSLYPQYTMSQVASSLTSSATDLGATGFDTQFGNGLLNVEAALGVDDPIEDPPPTQDPPSNPQQTSNDLYFTWYDTTANNKAWVLVGNPSTTQTASVNIRIGSAINVNYNIPPGGRVTPYWPNILAGPVVITSNLPVYASQRVIYGGSFNEMSGIKASELSTKYYFTWYDSSSPTIRTWILVGNPSPSQTASVTIKVGGSLMGGYNLGPGAVVTPLYNGLINGPVEITSNINVYATQRVLFEGSFNEVSGITLD